MSTGTTGGMKVLDGARRSSRKRDDLMGDVDLPRDGTVLSVVPGTLGVVKARADAGRAMEKFCEDLRWGILRTIDDRSSGTGSARGEESSMLIEPSSLGARRSNPTLTTEGKRDSGKIMGQELSPVMEAMEGSHDGNGNART